MPKKIVSKEHWTSRLPVAVLPKNQLDVDLLMKKWRRLVEIVDIKWIDELESQIANDEDRFNLRQLAAAYTFLSCQFFQF